MHRKFDYGADIQSSLEKETKTGIPVPSITIRMEADRSLSGDQEFIWGNNMVEYFKHENKLEEN